MEHLANWILVLALFGVGIFWILLGAVIIDEIKAVYNYYKEARNVSPRNR